jgi:DNA-directed RNA polymerase specialized sigma24 family protein
MDAATLARLHAATLRYARTRHCPDPMTDAEDLTSCAWLRSLPHLTDRFTEAEHRSYLRSATSCCAVDAQRAWRRRPTAPLPDWHPSGVSVEDEALALAELGRLLALVPPALLLFACGWLWGEIAAATGTNAHTLKVQAHRFRRAREALEA